MFGCVKPWLHRLVLYLFLARTAQVQVAPKGQELTWLLFAMGPLRVQPIPGCVADKQPVVCTRGHKKTPIRLRTFHKAAEFAESLALYVLLQTLWTNQRWCF